MALSGLRKSGILGPKLIIKEAACFSTSNSLMINWRIKKGIEPNPNRFGPLTNLPDYSYVDGRPVPLSARAYERLKIQESYCKKIVELSAEIDFAVERHKKMEEEKKLNIQKISDLKLKPKGEFTPKQ